ncbi:MAG: hypothetical protein MZU95_09625 [Desulfomicrobium escambiense]|jgi:hypothetical protein|nr:hypothetical protein [Desulfomicrobium escambiense]MCU0575234.1 hypothetical protein [Thermodesulfobacteriota bacterium]HWR68074.1 hypothetical protein [Desulfomonilia bacterium]
MDEYEAQARKIQLQRKHSMHEETLARVIQDLEENLARHDKYTGPESIFAHVKANAAALLFLCQERKRDRDKRKGDYSKPVQELPPSGSDIV